MSRSRTGTTRTLSISIDATTHRILTEEAEARFGGDVSRLLAAIARDARREAAVDRIADWSGYALLADDERNAIQADIDEELARQKPNRRRA